VLYCVVYWQLQRHTVGPMPMPLWAAEHNLKEGRKRGRIFWLECTIICGMGPNMFDTKCTAPPRLHHFSN
jgi:hypothetical protein